MNASMTTLRKNLIIAMSVLGMGAASLTVHAQEAAASAPAASTKMQHDGQRGPHRMLREVAQLASSTGAWCQVAMEAPMACGVGLCLSCVVPVKGKDDVTRPARCCVDGPVFGGDRVDWGLM